MASVGPETRPFRRRRWHHRRDVRFLIVVGALVALYLGHGFVNGPSRISERLQQRLDQDPAVVDVLVTAKFPAEAFHMDKYQAHGMLRGTEGRTTAIYKVTPDGVRTLSRYYWIENIDLAR